MACGCMRTVAGYADCAGGTCAYVNGIGGAHDTANAGASVWVIGGARAVVKAAPCFTVVCNLRTRRCCIEGQLAPCRGSKDGDLAAKQWPFRSENCQ